MPKLELTETARVLYAALGSETFTVEELVKRSSAKASTVRTVLFRAKGLVHEIDSVPNGRAGRRAKRYRLVDNAREQLSGELTRLTARFRSSQSLPDSLGAVEAALSAAGSLIQRLHDSASPVIDHEALALARAQLDAAERLLPGIKDSAKRRSMAERLSTLDVQHRRASAPDDPIWHERKDELAEQLEYNLVPNNDDDAAVDDNRVAVYTHNDAFSNVHHTSCLWFDATDGPSDPWSREIAAGLRDARCSVLRFPLQHVAGSSRHRDNLRLLVADMPARVIVLITMRSHQTTMDREAMQFLSGPLGPLLHRMGRDSARRHCTIAVMDHDLPEHSFWIDHDIANLRYYPTAKPSLARVLAEQLITHKRSVDFTANSLPVPAQFADMSGSVVDNWWSFRSPSHLDFPSLLSPANESLSPVAAALGFAALEAYVRRLAQRESASCLVGINRGGDLLGKLLAERHGVPNTHLLKCDCNPKSGTIFVDNDMPDNVTALILIDDVIRTGRTMGLVRTLFRDQHPNIPQYAVALAVVSSDNQGAVVPYDIDFCLWIARNPKLKFPWSDATGNNLNRYLDTEGVNQVGGWLTNHCDNESSDHRKAID